MIPIASLCVVSPCGIPSGASFGIPSELPTIGSNSFGIPSGGLRNLPRKLYRKVGCDCGEGKGEGEGYKTMGYRRQLYQKHRADCKCGGSTGGAGGKAAPSGANFGIPSALPTGNRMGIPSGANFGIPSDLPTGNRMGIPSGANFGIPSDLPTGSSIGILSGANIGILSELPMFGSSLGVPSPEFLQNLPRQLLRGSN